MEIAIKVLETEISNRKAWITKEDLMFKDKRRAMELLKEITGLKQALKVVKGYSQKRGN